MAAVQKLADDARTTGHAKAAEYEAILRQSRPLMFNPQFGEVIVRLLGSKEESQVAVTIAKMKQAWPQPPPHPYYPPHIRGRGGAPSRGRRGVKCFNCGLFGHFQRQCRNRQYNS